MRRAQGDVRGAEEDCRKALALSLDLQGPQHRATVDARRQLAALHVDQGRYSEAAAELTSSQAWLLARLGMEHEEVSRNYNSLDRKSTRLNSSHTCAARMQSSSG